jgi:glucose-1-phosphate cytidylyltransferase
MKAVILAGGFGTRISEETTNQPKPMVQIGDRPIIWHIMKSFESFGINEFIVCCGYKGYILKEYFANYYLHNSDFTIDLESNTTKILTKQSENWKITLVDTGSNTATGGRVKRISHLIEDTFMMTYGDGVSDVNLAELVEFHRGHGKEATVTAVQPPGRFGSIETNGAIVSNFAEKTQDKAGWINGGFFVLEPSVFARISNDQVAWENEPIQSLVESNQLAAYKHFGFWKPMDTLRDKNSLEESWQSGTAPWKVW